MSSAARPALQGAGFVGWAAAGLLLSATACASSTKAISARDASSPLRLQREIVLPGAKGRIDHLAVDLAGERLFVAEVANGSVEVLDLVRDKSVTRIDGLHEPQGVGWIPATGEFVVACGDGTVHFYSGRDYRETATIDLGGDADDVRIDPSSGRVVVGYGEGGLAVVDPAAHRIVSRVTFKGHPEGFALAGGRAWVNDPDDGAVLALDLDAGKVLARWPTHAHRLNFPMALTGDGKQIAIAYRLPAALARIDAGEGKTLSMQDSCGDSDDLYFAGSLVLVVCGAGHVDVVKGTETQARVETRGGGRTGLYVPELGSLFVALPARGNDPAVVWQLRLETNARSG